MGPIPIEDGEIDLVCRLVRRVGRTSLLTHNECRILETLAARPEQAVAREALEPSGEGPQRRLDRAIHRLRAKIELDPGSPAHLLTVRQVGYRLCPATRASRLPATNLGPAHSALIGRESLLGVVLDALGEVPVALVGLPGVGKSRLAEAVARARGAGWRIDLDGCGEIEEVTHAVRRALALDAEGPPGRILAVASILMGSRGGLRPVVVLDHVDMLDADALALLVANLDARLILTTRRAPPIDPVRRIEVPPLDPRDAARLFLERASELRTLDPAEQSPDRLRRIAAETDGLPLAVELVAGRVRSLGVDAIVRGLEAHKLALLRRSGADRHADLERTVAWSWALLDPPQQRALAQAAVFSGEFGGEAADVVVDPGGRGAVRQLCDLGLVSLAGDPPRFRVPTVIRELVRRREEAPDAVERLCERCTSLAETVSARRHGFGDRLARLGPDLPDLRAALARAEHHRPERAARLLLALSRIRDGWRETGRILALAGRVEDPELALRLSLLAAWNRAEEGDWRAALADAQSLVVAADALGKAELANSVRVLLVAASAELGDHDAALRQAREAEARVVDDPVERAVILGTIGGVLLSSHRFGLAAEHLERAVAAAEATGLGLGGLWLHNLGIARFVLGDAAGAEAAWRRALEIERRLGDRYTIGVITLDLGWASLLGGALEEAVVLLDEAADRFREGGAAGREGWVRMIGAIARLCAGDEAEALEIAGEVRQAPPIAEVVRAALWGLCVSRIEGLRILDRLGEVPTGLDPRDVAAVRGFCSGGPEPSWPSEPPLGLPAEARTLLGLVFSARASGDTLPNERGGVRNTG